MARLESWGSELNSQGDSVPEERASREAAGEAATRARAGALGTRWPRSSTAAPCLPRCLPRSCSPRSILSQPGFSCTGTQGGRAVRMAGSPGAWGCTGGAGSRLDHRRRFRIAEVLAPPDPGLLFLPTHPLSRLPRTCWQRRPPRGSEGHGYPRRHSGQTGWGCNCAVGLRTGSVRTKETGSGFVAGVRAGGKTMPSGPPRQSSGVLKESYGFRLL